MKNTILPILIFLTAFAIGCGDDDDSSTKNRDLLTAHPWKLTARTLSGVPVNLQSCDLDDTFTYTGFGQFRWDVGDELCFFDEKTVEWIWGFTDETQMEIFYNDTSDVNNVMTVLFCKVNELTETNMVLECSESGPVGLTTVDTFEPL